MNLKVMEYFQWTLISSHKHRCSEENFWNAVNIWNIRPNLINKRIFGVSLFNLGHHNNLNLFYEIIGDIKKEPDPASAVRYVENKSKFFQQTDSKDIDCNSEKSSLRFILFTKIILFKKDEPNSLEIALFDKEEKAAIFLEPLNIKMHYCLQFTKDAIEFKILSENFLKIDTEWHSSTLLPKLIKWMSNCTGVQHSSIALVPIDKYKMLYEKLKGKYSSDIKKIWTEVTDPDKFIHEDIAIATYLLLLWRDKPPQRFVDLGCGNGLLVHILNGESHLGVGYDLRARKIWEKYPSKTILKVWKIKPSKEQVFGQTDWIIGNHSDELTPWIPVFATFNSFDCNFFLLPCCAYEFDGSKFRRNNSSKSLYNDYLDYVENICNKCGFQVKRDRLRIPSTKRICFVSKGRTHSLNEFPNIKQSIDTFIEESSNSRVDDQNENWKINIKLRESEEKVRNCTQIDPKLKENIVNLISNILLTNKSNKSIWNEGNPTKLENIIQALPSNLLKQLKKEGKGIQTFIKNHHHIFKLENGFIKFREPLITNKKSENWKTKPCWFFKNHPDSCPLEDDKCSYIHNN